MFTFSTDVCIKTLVCKWSEALAKFATHCNCKKVLWIPIEIAINSLQSPYVLQFAMFYECYPWKCRQLIILRVSFLPLFVSVDGPQIRSLLATAELKLFETILNWSDI